MSWSERLERLAALLDHLGPWLFPGQALAPVRVAAVRRLPLRPLR